MAVVWLVPNTHRTPTLPTYEHDDEAAARETERERQEKLERERLSIEKRAADMAQSRQLQMKYEEGEVIRLKLAKEAAKKMKNGERAQKLVVEKAVEGVKKLDKKRRRQSGEDPRNVQYGATFDWKRFGFE